jgi:hypothetical protein
LGLGRYHEALELGTTAIAYLRERVSDQEPAAISLAGMLYLRMALAAARRGDGEAAREMLALADESARRLGFDGNLWNTASVPQTSSCTDSPPRWT